MLAPLALMVDVFFIMALSAGANVTSSATVIVDMFQAAVCWLAPLLCNFNTLFAK